MGGGLLEDEIDVAKEGKESERIEGGCINEAARVPTQHHSPSDVCVCLYYS